MKRALMKKNLLRVTRNKWTVLTFAAFYAVVAILAATLAWVTASDARVNWMKNKGLVGILGAKVTEVFVPPTTPPNPGDRIEKEVRVSNTGDKDCFVRVLVSPKVLSSEIPPLSLPCNGPDTAGILIYDDIDTTATNWAYGGDGYWYYLKKLTPNASTEPLFTAVEIDSGIDEAYDGASLEIDVKMNAVETYKWQYREQWWNTDAAPAGAALLLVDSKLSLLAIS